MEQARMFLAIALSFLVFFLWNIFFVEKKEAEKTGETPAVEEQTSRPVEMQEKEKIKDVRQKAHVEEVATAAAETEPLTKQTARVLAVDTPLYSIKISENRAAFKSFVLNNYRKNNGKDSPLKELISENNETGTYVLGVEENEIPGLSTAVFMSKEDADTITVIDKPRQLSFSWVSKDGVGIEKVYTFFPDTYIIGLEVYIKNSSEYSLGKNLTLSLFKNMEDSNGGRYGFVGPSAFIDDKLQNIETDDIEETSRLKGNVKWIGVQGRYFISCLVPKNVGPASMYLFFDEKNTVEARYSVPIKPILSGTEKRFDYEIFMGPKSIGILREANYSLEKALSFGWFDFISIPCLRLMNFLYGLIPNYGIDIIILTILIKILFWPLGNKSYKSMNEMKRLQPLMAEIRAKYKEDKKKMNEEIMKLYKTYKINPLGGCLPMVAQIPVFIAFYQMLYGAIELRHAPFFGWITDLSAPDRLFDFGAYGVSIPLMEPPYGIPVLTIVMGATMFIQQKLQPPAGDPAQAKMMMLLPIVFTFIFINFSSGLVLYWLINNVLSIAQQYYIYRKN